MWMARVPTTTVVSFLSGQTPVAFLGPQSVGNFAILDFAPL